MAVSFFHRAVAALAAAALLSLAGLQPTVRAAALGGDIAVAVHVEVHGHVDGLDQARLEETVDNLLEEAHFQIAESSGGRALVLAVVIQGDDDGEGFTIAETAGSFHEAEDATDADEIESDLVKLVQDFIAAHGE